MATVPLYYTNQIVVWSGGVLVPGNERKGFDDERIRVIALDPAGALDPDFGIDGVLEVAPHVSGTYRPMLARQADGRMLVVSGWTPDGQSVWRFDAAGEIDPSFGEGGHAPSTPRCCLDTTRPPTSS